MLFNSIEFALFFPLVYALYLALRHTGRNRLLLVASYVFYGAWDWRFLSLILVSTVIDYYCALGMETISGKRKRKAFLFASITANLGILGVFKYYDFFASSLNILLAHFNFPLHALTIDLVLPVGISFYTFQTMSYTIDVYKKEMKPTRQFLNFALFVAFFPQLVAGPIERAKHLLPQILKPRTVTLDKFASGCQLIFYGLFLKIFVADNLAALVDSTFTAYKPHAAETTLALYAFAFQILCDFAGYSSIARGLGRVMGFDIIINFRTPYFCANPSEFWQHWHISLSGWLRDYLYIPLGGNRLKKRWKTYRNLMLTMALGGLWHGAEWTFVIWGLYHGLLLIVYRLLPQITSERWTLGRFLRVLLFFHLVCLGWLFFRAESLNHLQELCRSFFYSLFHAPDWNIVQYYVFNLSFILWLPILINVLQRRKNDTEAILRLPTWTRWTLYAAMFYLMTIWGSFDERQFIYFQF